MAAEDFIEIERYRERESRGVVLVRFGLRERIQEIFLLFNSCFIYLFLFIFQFQSHGGNRKMDGNQGISQTGETFRTNRTEGD